MVGVRLCPTGTLRYESLGAVADEEPEETTSVEVTHENAV
jgi:hypothetical protein